MEQQDIVFPEYSEECPDGVYERITVVEEEQTDADGVMHPADRRTHHGEQQRRSEQVGACFTRARQIGP